MLTSLFNYTLPPESIAQYPASPRDTSRLLEVTGDGLLVDHTFSDLPALLQPGDLLVFNDSKVIPARLSGMRDKARVEITLFKQLDNKSWRILAKPAKRLSVGDVIRFGGGFTATVEEKTPDGFLTVRFPIGGADLLKAFHHFGMPPLPPYIRRGKAEPADAKTYQTVYARHEGSVAAPTAGLHFTPAVMQALAARGVETTYVTLHVGGGTFLPVKVDDTDDHVMHAEWGQVAEETAAAVRTAKHNGKRVIAVGTTALRTLEAAAAATAEVQPFSGDINLFITPGYHFKTADCLLTNFHLPRSTLLMLVSAFTGMERIQQVYAHAIANGYRFYSYGDASLLHRFETPAIS